jgi:hypothetical protein
MLYGETRTHLARTRKIETPERQVPATPRRIIETLRPLNNAVRLLSRLRMRAWKAFLASWLAFIFAILVFFGGSRPGLFTVGVIVVLAAAFFGVPFLLWRIAQRTKPTIAPRDVELADGRISQSEALMQILLAPVALTLAMAIIGYIASLQE